MCAGDVTPLPTRYYDSVDRNYVDSDVTHTCRNFDQIHSWVKTKFYAGDGKDLEDAGG